MRVLARFQCDYGRMGSIEGLLVCDDSQITEYSGYRVVFGEILGKHSDVAVDLDESQFTILSDDQDKITWLVDVVNQGDWTISGYNPFDYIQDDDGED